MLVLLCPGQGSQTPGQLTPWLDLPDARERVGHWSALIDLDLLHLGTDASAEQVRDTAVAQPLLAATALLSAAALPAGNEPDLVCGHSIGELPALALAGVLTDDEVVQLAARRGAAMAAAAARRPTGMVAVLGGGDVSTHLARHDVEVATVNVAGQVVVGGGLPALQALVADPPPGARVRLLEVAGAFHTAAMAPAREVLEQAVAVLQPSSARCGVVANADGAVLTDGAELLRRLPAQLTGPVRFDLCLAALAGADTVVELAPGGTLAALVRRALPEARSIALRTPADAAAIRPVAA